jgi:hypothetical protein
METPHWNSADCRGLPSLRRPWRIDGSLNRQSSSRIGGLVEPYHLNAYVTEKAFRFNNRATKDNPLNDADRFALAVSQIAGKRLTYKELIGKVGETAN